MRWVLVLPMEDETEARIQKLQLEDWGYEVHAVEMEIV